MESAQEDDFTVQVVRLDVVRLPIEALPGGPALSGLTRNGTDAKEIAPAGFIFAFRNEINVSSAQTSNTFLTSQSRERPGTGG